MKTEEEIKERLNEIKKIPAAGMAIYSKEMVINILKWVLDENNV